MGSLQPGWAPLRLVDLRNVLDATVDAAVTGLQGLAASLPQQSDAERCADVDCGSRHSPDVPDEAHRYTGRRMLRLGRQRPAFNTPPPRASCIECAHAGSARCCAICTRRGSGCCACTWSRRGAARPMRWPTSAVCRTSAPATPTRCATPPISLHTCTASSAACRRDTVPCVKYCAGQPRGLRKRQSACSRFSARDGTTHVQPPSGLLQAARSCSTPRLPSGLQVPSHHRQREPYYSCLATARCQMVYPNDLADTAEAADWTRRRRLPSTMCPRRRRCLRRGRTRCCPPSYPNCGHPRPRSRPSAPKLCASWTSTSARSCSRSAAVEIPVTGNHAVRYHAHRRRGAVGHICSPAQWCIVIS